MEYREGNLLRAFRYVDAIAHVTNCQGVMGSGVALQIKEKFPEAYEAYRKHYEDSKRHNATLLGDISFANTRSFLTDEYVFNLNAQDFYGTDKRHLNYEAFYRCLIKMKAVCIQNKICHIGVPFKMGADRAGGDWNIITAMIESVFPNDSFNPSNIKITAFKL